MEDNKKIDKKTFIISGLLVLLVICGVIYMLTNNKNNTTNNIQDNNMETNLNEIKDSTIDIQKYVKEENTANDLITYNIDLYKVMEDFNMTDELLKLGDYNITLAYKIKAYDIKLELVSSPYDDVMTYDMYVNDTLTSGDGYKHEWEPYFTMYTLGDNLINESHFNTDVAHSLDVINVKNNEVKLNTIHNLDQVKGMIFSKMNISSDGIIVDGTRIYYCNINYEKMYDIFDGDGYSKGLNELSDDIVVSAKYFYKYENGVLNLTPEISDKVTLKEYLDSNPEKCN